MLKGIDISHHQAGINIPETNVDFVIMKATEGVGYVDEYCDKFYQSAKASGKKLGVYHFARPDLGNTAIDEADFFVKNIKGYLNEAILVLDWEPTNGKIADTGWAKAWLDRVYSQTGIKPIIYMSASPMRSFSWQSVVDGDYGLWVANYGINDGQPHEEVFNKYSLCRWSFYALWQYTSKGKVNGYSGNVDMNYFTGDTTAWDKYAGKTTNTPVRKTNEQIAEEVLQDLWGTKDTNPTRKQRLEAAGYNYDEIQAIVNSKQNYHETIYVVQKNDGLIKIGQKLGKDWKKIASDNNIQPPKYIIYPGQKLVIK